MTKKNCSSSLAAWGARAGIRRRARRRTRRRQVPLAGQPRQGRVPRWRRARTGFLTGTNLNQDPRAEVWALTSQPDSARGWRETMEQIWSATSLDTGRTSV